MKKPLLFALLGPLSVAAFAQPDAASFPTRPAASTVGQLQQVLSQTYANGTWADQSRSLYQRYRLPTAPGWIVSQTFGSNTWATQSRVRYQYRASGDILTDTVDVFTPSPGGPSSAQVWRYNGQGQQQESHSQTYNRAASRWDTTSRTQYTYTGLLKTRDLTQGYATRRYINQGQTLYSYTAAGQPATQEVQTWNATAGTWNPASRTTFGYDAQGRLQQVVFETVLPPATALSNYFRYTYQYNPQNQVATVVGELWQNGAWRPHSQQFYAYDTNGNPAVVTLQTWTSGVYQNSSRQVFTYALVSAARPVAAPAAAPQVWPNPSQGAARLTFAPLAGAATVAVLDAAGRLVATLPVPAGAAALPLPASLPAGLYMLRLQAPGHHGAVRWVQQ